MRDAVSTSEMSVNFYETAQRKIPEDSCLHFLSCLCFKISGGSGDPIRGCSERKASRIIHTHRTAISVPVMTQALGREHNQLLER
jgi:hypothetical protein